MEDKRVLLALILSMLVWVGYAMFFAPQPVTVLPAETPAVETVAAPSAGTPPPAAAAPVKTVPEIAAETGVSRLLTIESPLYRLVFSSRGGRVQTIELRNYRQDLESSAPVYLLHGEPAEAGYLALSGDGSFGQEKNRDVIFMEDRDLVTLATGDSYTLRILSASSAGARIVREITFRGDSYDAPVNLTVEAPEGVALTGTLALSLLTPWDAEKKVEGQQFVGPVSFVAGDLEKIAPKDLKKEAKSFSEGVSWTAFSETYFMTALVPASDNTSSLLVQQAPGLIENRLISRPLTLVSGQPAVLAYTFFFGPKDVDVLKAADHHLIEGLDLGVFAPIAEPLLYVLKFFYRYVSNYGLCIILLTVIIKLLFWPLTQKSYTSMKAMQKLQPKMQELREKYRDDKQRLNTEMMALYRENRVNPMGGCLPMLVQIPVFFALYRVLMSSIELRHAPLALWIQDLSAADPYYITPLIMGATMFIQQKLTPVAGDPMQAKVMQFMPIIFTFMFLNFPAGLVLYWLVNNVLSIAQQALILRSSKA